MTRAHVRRIQSGEVGSAVNGGLGNVTGARPARTFVTPCTSDWALLATRATIAMTAPRAVSVIL